MTSHKYRITYRLRHARDVECVTVSGYDALTAIVADLFNTETLSFINIQKEPGQ